MPGLASLLSRRTTNPRAAGAAARRNLGPRAFFREQRMADRQPFLPQPPPGGKHGGLLGYRNGGRTMNPRAAGAAAMLRNRRIRPVPPSTPSPIGYTSVGTGPGSWQEGGPVGVAPEEVAMASEIFARASPEQQAQITGGGGGPGMMDEEAAIGEALAMAMGGGGGPPMGGPPMNGAPPMGGLI